MHANPWSLGFDLKVLMTSADKWHLLSDAAATWADELDEAARKVRDNGWESTSADHYDEHRKQVVGGLDAVSESSKEIAQTLRNVAGLLEKTQEVLDREWTQVASIPHTTSGPEGEVSFDGVLNPGQRQQVEIAQKSAQMHRLHLDDALGIESARLNAAEVRVSEAADMINGSNGLTAFIEDLAGYATNSTSVVGHTQSGGAGSMPVGSLGAMGGVGVAAVSIGHLGDMSMAAAGAAGLLGAAAAKRRTSSTTAGATGPGSMGAGAAMGARGAGGAASFARGGSRAGSAGSRSDLSTKITPTPGSAGDEAAGKQRGGSSLSEKDEKRALIQERRAARAARRDSGAARVAATALGSRGNKAEREEEHDDELEVQGAHAKKVEGVVLIEEAPEEQGEEQSDEHRVVLEPVKPIVIDDDWEDDDWADDLDGDPAQVDGELEDFDDESD